MGHTEPRLPSSSMAVSEVDKIIVEDVFVIVLGAFGLFVCFCAAIAYGVFALYERACFPPPPPPPPCAAEGESSIEDS